MKDEVEKEEAEMEELAEGLTVEMVNNHEVIRNGKAFRNFVFNALIHLSPHNCQ